MTSNNQSYIIQKDIVGPASSFEHNKKGPSQCVGKSQTRIKYKYLRDLLQILNLA